MSKIIEVEVFKYDELSDSAKSKAREWYIEGMDYDWWDSMYEMCIEDGKELGFDIAKINFSGFYSQGDGACWMGEVDVAKWLETHAKDSIGISAWCQLIQESVVTRYLAVDRIASNYSHEETMRFGEIVDDTECFEDDYTMQHQSIFKGMSIANLFDIIEADTDCPYKCVEHIEKAIEDSCKDYAQDIYKRLREEYEYLCSEEMMIDHFNCNDYHFTNEGVLA